MQEQQSTDGTRSKFGNRHLNDSNDVFQHNAWDDVEWDTAQENEALKKVLENSKNYLSSERADELELKAGEFWDDFYTQHKNRFFKDRNWLFTEFPELLFKTHANIQLPVKKEETTNKSYRGASAKLKILEVGCGVGNTVFPIMKANQDAGHDLFVYCCDFSETAVQLVKDHELYNEESCCAFHWDITKRNDDESESDIPFPENSLDIVVMIFVLSAITPKLMLQSLKNVTKFLKPGGLLLFRDYGQLDLAQIRFKNGQCITENFYVRGDGTRVYFFTQDQLDQMFNEVSLQKESNHIDRRLIVNRGKKLKMYRVWIQCRYRKKIAA